MFYRLIKPVWAKKLLANKKPNPQFVEDIEGLDVVEGYNYTPEYLEEMNEKGYNIYFFPNHPSSDVYAEQEVKSLSGKHIDIFEYVFVDMDLKDEVYETKEAFLEVLRAFPLKPTTVVDSGHGIHAYWKVSDLTRKNYVVTQLALMKHFDTDDSVWTVLQLMRVPGYLNTKNYGKVIRSQVLQEDSSNQEYLIADFPKDIYQDLDIKRLGKARDHIAKLEGRAEFKLSEEIDYESLPTSFIQLLKENRRAKELFETPEEAYNQDRSGADMALANLLFVEGFTLPDAIAVIANSKKALEKGANRLPYAKTTVEKVFKDRPTKVFHSVRQHIENDSEVAQGTLVRGPSYLDGGVLGRKWRKKELLGIISGPGIGKTALALNIFLDTIRNNPEDDELFVFFSLEMPKEEIIQKWLEVTMGDLDLADRLYVIDTQDEEGMPLIIGLQEIFEHCVELKRITGRSIKMLAIDHFHILSTHVDRRKKPDFGAETEQGTGFGNVRNLSKNALATQLKTLAKVLDTFGIILTQTTKEKGIGDVPLYKDACYGVANYEWIMDRILTLWQPLMRVEHLTETKFTAYQYAKIRAKHPDDKIKTLEQKVMVFDMATGAFRMPNPEQYQEFEQLLPVANELRDKAGKKNGNLAYTMAEMLEEL